MLSGYLAEIYEHYLKPVLKFLIFSKNYFQKHKSSAQPLNSDLMWLVNELVLTFSALIKCTKAQFNLIILSRVMPHTSYRQTDRQTDRHFRKNPFFLTQGFSKRKDLMKISKVIFHIKPIPSHPWWECKKFSNLYVKVIEHRARSAITESRALSTLKFPSSVQADFFKRDAIGYVYFGGRATELSF